MQIRIKALTITMFVAISGACATEVASLLRENSYEHITIYGSIIEGYKQHLWEIRQNNKSPIVQFDNPYYAESVYTVIISEICKCSLGDELYKGGDKYGEVEIMDFKASDGYKAKAEYDRSNFNYLILINVLNAYKRQIDNNRLQIIDDEFVKNVAKKIDPTVPATRKSVFDDAINDILTYMHELDLYKYIMQKVSPKPKLLTIRYVDGKPDVRYEESPFKNKWKNWLNANKIKSETKYDKMCEHASDESSLANKNRSKVASMIELYKDEDANLMNDKKTFQGTARGIYNFGNTSYFSASMQLLYVIKGFRNLVYDIAKEQRKKYERISEYNEPKELALVINDLFNIIGINVSRIGDEDIYNQQRKAYKRMKEILTERNNEDIEKDPAKLIKDIMKHLDNEANAIGINMKEKLHLLVTDEKVYTAQSHSLQNYDDVIVMNKIPCQAEINLSMRYCEDGRIVKMPEETKYKMYYRNWYVADDDKVEVSDEAESMDNTYIIRYKKYR
ncbi:MAG: hypothetical protein IJS10_00610 [Alphaproteobacteria bacterium]|nr:hypothetical protein [Alphaproteobacteria bacterium]